MKDNTMNDPIDHSQHTCVWSIVLGRCVTGEIGGDTTKCTHTEAYYVGEDCISCRAESNFTPGGYLRVEGVPHTAEAVEDITGARPAAVWDAVESDSPYVHGTGPQLLADLTFNPPAQPTKEQHDCLTSLTRRLRNHDLLVTWIHTHVSVEGMTLNATGPGGYQHEQRITAYIDEWGADDFAEFEAVCIQRLGD